MLFRFLGKLVAEFVAFCCEIAFTLVAGRCDDRDLLDDIQFHPSQRKCVTLFRVVRQQSKFSDSDVFQDLHPNHVVSHIGLEAQAMIRLDRVEPLILKLVGLEFREQSNAPALLGEVHDRSTTFLVDHLHRHVELITAIAPQGIQQVTRET